MVIHANASEDKPVKAFRSSGSVEVYFDDNTKETIDGTSKIYTKPLWMLVGRCYSGTRDFFYGNITH